MRNPKTPKPVERKIEDALFFGRRVIDDYEGLPGDTSGTHKGPTVFDKEGENGWTQARRKSKPAK